MMLSEMTQGSIDYDSRYCAGPIGCNACKVRRTAAIAFKFFLAGFTNVPVSESLVSLHTRFCYQSIGNN
jgi:hypothetical protein